MSRPSRRWVVRHLPRRIANSIARRYPRRPGAGRQRACRWRRTLRTQRGRRRYARRKAIVEPVFGQIKPGRGYRQFLLRGMRQVRGEGARICPTHKMLKLWTALRQRRPRPGEGLRVLRGAQKELGQGRR